MVRPPIGGQMDPGVGVGSGGNCCAIGVHRPRPTLQISPPWPWTAAAVDAQQQYDRVAATQENLALSVTSLARPATDRADRVKHDHLAGVVDAQRRRDGRARRMGDGG